MTDNIPRAVSQLFECFQRIFVPTALHSVGTQGLTGRHREALQEGFQDTGNNVRMDKRKTRPVGGGGGTVAILWLLVVMQSYELAKARLLDGSGGWETPSTALEFLDLGPNGLPVEEKRKPRLAVRQGSGCVWSIYPADCVTGYLRVRQATECWGLDKRNQRGLEMEF